MGAIYLATDTVLLRNVALKVLPENIANDKKRLSRFEREAHAVSALNHPNILTVHEFGHENGIHYLATEFVDGRTLRDELQTGDLSLIDALSIAEQAALALSAAHAAGIVHRDIKPENIMVRNDGIVKVLDFGLVKFTDAKGETSDAEASTKLNTNPGVVMGTVAYMSPEQAKGRPVDERTDIWSLGIVLYEMICETTPFDGESTNDVIAAILRSEPKPISNYLADVPRDLERLVGKCLRKDPEQRYQHIKDVLIDIRELKQELAFELKEQHSKKLNVEANTQTFVHDHPTNVGTSEPTNELLTIHQTSSAEYVVSEIKQHKRGFILLSIGVLFAAIGFGYWFFSNRISNAAPIESIAVMPFVNASGNNDVEYLSDGMTETLINSLSQLPKLSVKGRSSVFRYKGKDVEPRTIGTELSVQAVLNGRVVQRGDSLILSLDLVDTKTGNQIWGEQYSRKLTDILSLQHEIGRDVSNKLRAKLSGEDTARLAKNYTANPEAYQLYLQGRYHWNKRTDEDIKKSTEYFQKAIDKDPNYALAYVGLADSYIVVPVLPARESHPKAKAAALKALSIDPSLGEAHAALANSAVYYEWDWPNGEKEYKRAIELSPQYATSHHWYGESLALVGRFDDSFAEYGRALELEPLSLAISTDLAYAYVFARQYDRAIEHLKKLAVLDPNYVRTHYYLARAYEEKGMLQEAIESYAKGRLLDGENPAAVATYVATFNAVLKTSGANGYWQKLVEIENDQGVKGNLYPVVVAGYYARLNDRDRVFPLLEIAFEARATDMAFLNVSPEWDNVRSDPRFRDLLRRVGLPH